MESNWEGRAVPRVLVSDDSPVVRRVLRRVLEGAGCEVREAGDLAAALALLETSAYDVVVTDLQEPQSDRERLFSAARRQRADVIVLTAAELAGRDWPLPTPQPEWSRSITKKAAAALEVVKAVKGFMAKRRHVRAIRFTLRHPICHTNRAEGARRVGAATAG
jgi:CheY-like chemotaxis protein